MKITNDDNYTALSVEWQRQIMTMLKSTLEHHQVDQHKLKDICSSFAFELSMLQDQDYMELQGKAYRPVVCFEAENGKLYYKPHSEVQIHEFTHAIAADIFDS